MHLFRSNLNIKHLSGLEGFVGFIAPHFWFFGNTEGALFKCLDIAGAIHVEKVHWRSVAPFIWFTGLIIQDAKNQIKNLVYYSHIQA